jgi:putative ribosome biogenesis GTPase RsgA
MPSTKLPAKLEGKRYVVLDGVQDPGNVGTILRTADAFSADGMLLVNACADLYNPKTVRATMGAVFRCPVWTCDADALRELLAQGICCFAGQSGVGKSTLLSAATGLELKTGEISKKISRGKHTTRHAELMQQGPYQVLDTPGFSLLELWSGMEPIELKNYYPDFAPYEGECRFSPCYHYQEPDCAVLAAAKAGKLGQQRLERYHQLLEKVREAWRKRYD